MIVYTQGCFDLFHVGHLRLLRRCSKFGQVYVALLSDEAYESYRGYRPIVPFEERKAILESCKYVYKVIKSDNKKTREEVTRLKVDIIAVGTDWAIKDLSEQYGVSKEWLDELVVYIPYTNLTSSTKIKEKIISLEKI